MDRKIASTPVAVLRRSRYLSFFRKKDEIYLYHDLWGYILAMDRNVHEFIEAFGEGAAVEQVLERFAGRLPLEQMEGFVDSLRLHRSLVAPDVDEEGEAYKRGHPVRAHWALSMRAGERYEIAYRDRAEGRLVTEVLGELESAFLQECTGEKTMRDIAEKLADRHGGVEVLDRVQRFAFRLAHSDRQFLKLADRPLAPGLFAPPYLRSSMPYPRLDDPQPEAAPVVDLSSYHRESIGDAQSQFDVEETTLSHMFREPHPALAGRTYGQAFLEALRDRDLLPDPAASRSGCPGRVVEVGGGVGYFARAVLETLEATDPERYARIGYTILDLSDALQASQRRLAEALGGRVTFLQANASRRLPLRPESVDLLVSNEVVADLETVQLTRTDLDGATAPRGATEAQGERILAARELIRRHGLPTDDAPEVFWLNLGALQLVEDLWRVVRPGGAAVLTEFGGPDRYPVESTHLDHSEFSIHFGHLAFVASKLGFEVELCDILELLHLDGDIKVLSTTRTYFEGLRALLKDRDVELEKLAYTHEQLAELCGYAAPLHEILPLRFQPIKKRALGLHAPEFHALILRKPDPDAA